MTTYSADLSAGSLMLVESRRIASLLLRSPSRAEWDHAIKVENILQKATPSTAIRQARLIRFRLEPLGRKAWSMVAHADREVASQTLFAAAIQHSQLLRAFVRTVLAGHHRRLDTQIHIREWEPFLAECAASDPGVLSWTQTTRAKLLQVVVRILVESGYLESSRSLRLRAPQVHHDVKHLLRDLGYAGVIKTMELHP